MQSGAEVDVELLKKLSQWPILEGSSLVVTIHASFKPVSWREIQQRDA